MTLANWITSIRFILSPLIFWQFISHSKNGLVWAVIFLFIAGVSDVVDGWVARARNEVSELGKTLDPLSDKLIILATLCSLIWWGLPGWMVLVYLLKETVQILAGAFLLKKYHQLIPANRWGKSSTFAFFVGFAIFFIRPLIGIVIIGIALFLSFYALFTYYQAYLKLKID